MSQKIVTSAQWRALVKLYEQQLALFLATAENIRSCANCLETAIEIKKLDAFAFHVNQTSSLALNIARQARPKRTDKAKGILFRDKEFRRQVRTYIKMCRSPLYDGNRFVHIEVDGKFDRRLKQILKSVAEATGAEKEQLDNASWQIWVAQHQLEALVDQVEALLALNSALFMACCLQWNKEGRSLKITGQDAV
jgi:hypothetical protein